MHDPLASVQVRHRHDLDHETCPPREMLRSLSSACLRVILFPCEARLFPLIEDVIHEVFPKSGVDFGGLGFVWARLGSNVLDSVSSGKLKGLRGSSLSSLT